MINLIVVDQTHKWPLKIADAKIISADEYLNNQEYSDARNYRVYNLCASYKYQSLGYYVSLLAEARNHRSLPNIKTIQDFKSKTIMRTISDEIENLIQKSLAKIKSKNFDLSIYFGKNLAKQYDSLSTQLYNLFQAPLLRANFIYQKKWILKKIQPISLADVPEHHRLELINFATQYFKRPFFRGTKKTKTYYDLAILYDPKEKFKPSNEKSISKFITAANNIGLNTQIINKNDYAKIPMFDAIFIRETTAVNHHTYRFARRGEAEGLVVIDDHESIIKCTNKVYLAELMKKNNVPCPKTLIINNFNQCAIIESELGFPCVIKLPDGSFSQSVVKVENINELKSCVTEYFKKSGLILVQEFMPTDFDWRIGILDKKPLFACKYYMVKKHWQIYQWNKQKKLNSGNFETFAIENVPSNIIKVALKAANSIGSGFYGVDIKASGSKCYLIEVNDNPNVDCGVEDFVIKDELYKTIMKSIFNRIILKKQYEK